MASVLDRVREVVVDRLGADESSVTPYGPRAGASPATRRDRLNKKPGFKKRKYG